MAYDEHQRQVDPPIKEGDIMNVTVVGHGSKGTALTKIEGYTVFINQPEGEITLGLGAEATIKIQRTLNRFGFADIHND